MSDIQEEQKRLYKIAEENDIKLLQEENKRLKELCDKYEEEHNTTFIEWKKDIKANKKAIEYINKYCEDYVIEDSPDEMCLFYGEDGTYKPEAKQELLDILKGDNK